MSMVTNWFNPLGAARQHAPRKRGRRRHAQRPIVSAEVEELESRVMLSATAVATFVEHVAQTHQTSQPSETLQTRLSNLASLIETRLRSADESSEGRFGPSRLGEIVQAAHQQLHQQTGEVPRVVPGTEAPARQIIDTLHREHSLLSPRSEPASLATMGHHNPAARLTQLLVDVVSKITQDLETIEAGGTISGEDLLAGLLERIGERFDIDFGPGDGSGCGTAETDAFIPDAIGNVDLGPACTTHDAAYSNLELTKAESDLAFFSDVFDAAQAGGATTVESFVLSSVYYASVFYFGGPAWLAAQQEAMQNA